MRNNTQSKQKALNHNKDLGHATILHPYHPLYGQSFPILKARKVNGIRRYSLQSGDDVFAVPETWVSDVSTNAFSDSYFDPCSIQHLLELADLLKTQ